jgi:sec-independent protein translocase protein TatB
MFEISWSELLILAIVTLIFVGPKELPVFLRTLGRYAGSVKRQANEFRAQFDAAMREAELDAVKKEFEGMQASVNAEVMGAKQAFDDAARAPPSPPPVPLTDEALASVPQMKQLDPTLPMPPMPAPPSMER